MVSFWAGRKVLLTGHTGFKGAWMSLWLRSLGAEVTGLALAPATQPNLWMLIADGSRSFIGDIRNAEWVTQVVREADPEIVIHMAAQSLVRPSYSDPVGTYATNVLGTAHLLQACRTLTNLECVLVITSDKVYENHGEGRAFEEKDRLGGHDPYSNSKACTELVTQSFRDSYFKNGPPVATARAGNVIGGGDWASDRLVPDCVRALDAGVPVALRYPDAVRPWQHVLEPLSGYLAFVRHLVEHKRHDPLALNFGPDPDSFCTVREVVEAFSERFGGKPGWIVDGKDHPAEARMLTLSSKLAQLTLGWRPRLNIDTALSWTADWYRAHRDGTNMLEFTQLQINRYQALIEEGAGTA